MFLRTSIIVISILVLAACGERQPNGSGGVTSESKPTFSSIQKSAQQGDTEAQFNLGVLYEKGRGVSQDYAEARKWYLRAAEKGHASSQYNLGVLYGNGWGVSPDYAEARKWYLRAAENGHASSQYNLGLLYYKGQGGRVDYKLAYAWFHASAEQGNENAKKIRPVAGAELDPASLAEARKLAEQYHKSYVESFK